MVALGLVFLLLGFVLAVPVLWTLGVILVVVGAVLWVAEGSGRSWGHRWY